LNIFNNTQQKKILRITTQMKLGELQHEFKKEFGVTLRLFHKLILADPNIALNSITQSTQELIIDKDNTIKELCDMFQDTYGIKIQIADNKDTQLLNIERKLRE